MFLLRSAFWLTVAFVLIAPRDADLGKTAADLSAQAVAAGQTFIVGRMLGADCTECGGVLAVLPAAAAPVSPSLDPTMQDSSSQAVPIPRPRPAWMG